MFAFSSPLFWYKLVFTLELVLAEILATYTLRKRSHFAVRVIVSIVAVFAFAFLLPVSFAGPAANTVRVSIMFLLLFAATVAAMKFCYQERTLSLFFCGVVAYTTQHVAYSTFSHILSMTGGDTYNLYGETTAKTIDPITVSIYMGTYLIIYWFVWAFIEHRIREQEKLRIEPLLLFSLAGILFVNIVLSISVTYLLAENLSKTEETILYLYRIMNCIFGYVVLYAELGKHLAETELETVETLWQQDKRSYELSQKNIELINVMCHDLRHQLRKGGSGDAVDGTYMARLENSIMIYDSSIKTGNDALDLILAENSVFLAEHKIKLSVIADGAKLDFMSAPDIYSLFGNALQNAEEAVCTLEDVEKRTIILHVRAEAKMVVIHIENYAEQVRFGEDGLPITNKPGRGHGYGMRSMKMIAEKYGGFLTTTMEDRSFCLDIILPLPTNQG